MVPQTACRLVVDDDCTYTNIPAVDVPREGLVMRPQRGLAEREALAWVMPGFRRGWCKWRKRRAPPEQGVMATIIAFEFRPTSPLGRPVVSTQAGTGHYPCISRLRPSPSGLGSLIPHRYWRPCPHILHARPVRTPPPRKMCMRAIMGQTNRCGIRRKLSDSKTPCFRVSRAGNAECKPGKFHHRHPRQADRRSEGLSRRVSTVTLAMTPRSGFPDASASGMTRWLESPGQPLLCKRPP